MIPIRNGIISRLFSERDGATGVEYMLILALMAVQLALTLYLLCPMFLRGLVGLLPKIIGEPIYTP